MQAAEEAVRRMRSSGCGFTNALAQGTVRPTTAHATNQYAH